MTRGLRDTFRFSVEAEPVLAAWRLDLSSAVFH